MTSSTIDIEPKEPEFEPVDLVPISNGEDVSSCSLSDSSVVSKYDCIDNLSTMPQFEQTLVATSQSTNNAPSPVKSYSKIIINVSKTSDGDEATSLLYSETGVTIQIEDMDSSVVSPISRPKSNSEDKVSYMERNPDVFSDFDYTFPSESAKPDLTTSTIRGIDQNTSATHILETVETKQFINNETLLVCETVQIIVVTDFSVSILLQETNASGLNEKDEVVGFPDIESIDFNATRTSMFEPLSSESERSFPSPGIPTPSRPALHVAPSRVVVPLAIDHLQGQDFAALQAPKGLFLVKKKNKNKKKPIIFNVKMKIKLFDDIRVRILHCGGNIINNFSFPLEPSLVMS